MLGNEDWVSNIGNIQLSLGVVMNNGHANFRGPIISCIDRPSVPALFLEASKRSYDLLYLKTLFGICV